MSLLSTSVLSLACAASLVACVQQETAPSSIARAIPTPDQVRIELPGSSVRTVGQLAEWYVATRGVTVLFNGGTGWVLALIHTIVQFPVTSVDGDTYTWGPWSGALDFAEYKLEVRILSDGTFAYQLSGRPKLTQGSPFEVIIDGVSDPRPGRLQASGSFLVDMDASRRVNPRDTAPDSRGTISVAYDLAAKHLDLTLMSTDGNGQPVVAEYAYDEAPDGGGTMVFAFDTDAGGTPTLERATLRSRWQADGAGRADARLTGGDLTTEVLASECWNSSFRRVYYADSILFAQTEGDEAECVFATADLPPAP
jgi:hypothetical protein